MGRLTRPEQFTAVLSGGCKLAGTCFLVQAQPNAAAGARLGIIAGRKAIARAVDRNRSKRLVREVFRATREALETLDVIVVCRQAVPRGGNTLARRELEQLFAELGGHGGQPAPKARRRETKR